MLIKKLYNPHSHDDSIKFFTNEIENLVMKVFMCHCSFILFSLGTSPLSFKLKCCGRAMSCFIYESSYSTYIYIYLKIYSVNIYIHIILKRPQTLKHDS